MEYWSFMTGNSFRKKKAYRGLTVVHVGVKIGIGLQNFQVSFFFPILFVLPVHVCFVCQFSYRLMTALYVQWCGAMQITGCYHQIMVDLSSTGSPT